MQNKFTIDHVDHLFYSIGRYKMFIDTQCKPDERIRIYGRRKFLWGKCCHRVCKFTSYNHEDGITILKGLRNCGYILGRFIKNTNDWINHDCPFNTFICWLYQILIKFSWFLIFWLVVSRLFAKKLRCKNDRRNHHCINCIKAPSLLTWLRNRCKYNFHPHLFSILLHLSFLLPPFFLSSSITLHFLRTKVVLKLLTIKLEVIKSFILLFLSIQFNHFLGIFASWKRGEHFSFLWLLTSFDPLFEEFFSSSPFTLPLILRYLAWRWGEDVLISTYFLFLSFLPFFSISPSSFFLRVIPLSNSSLSPITLS